ncbi:MAG: polysaccharide deacetylase family protein [Planctomycetes bacterium]|nr:polysaccharide deacetylase family protein [Planctomycetota bacterium]
MGALSAIRRLLSNPPRPALAILGFHNITPTFSQPYLSPQFPSRFRALVRRCKRAYELVTVREAMARLDAGEPMDRPMLAFIFDDGYADMHEVIAPILLDEGATGTSYVVLDSLRQGGVPWYDELGRVLFRTRRPRLEIRQRGQAVAVDLDDDPRQRVDAFWSLVRRLKSGFEPATLDAVQALASEHELAPHDPRTEPLMMTIDQAKALVASGIEVGCHSRSHPILPSLDAAGLDSEIIQCRLDLEADLGSEVATFCYPNGDNDPRCVEKVAAAGYRAAVSMACGANLPGSLDRFRLRRAAMSEEITRLWPIHTALRVRSALVAADQEALGLAN